MHGRSYKQLRRDVATCVGTYQFSREFYSIMQEEEMFYVAASALKEFTLMILHATGLNKADAETVASVLIAADLEGIPSHGISRLAIYIRRVRAGLATAVPDFKWNHPASAVALLDANNALGPVAATAAIDEAIRLAHIQGVGMVGVSHTNHTAILSAYTERATKANCIALMTCNTPPAIAPWGGKKAFFGTNPIAFSAPGSENNETPVVVDMATSITARGNIIMAMRQGKDIPEGWAIDADGNTTTNARAALEGAVLPMAEAKGYALALMVEILSAILPGTGWGPNVHSPYDNWVAPTDSGLWCLAIHLGPLMSKGEYASRMSAMLTAIREVPVMPQQNIRIPGERRARSRTERLRTGIPLDAATYGELNELSKEFGIMPLNKWQTS